MCNALNHSCSCKCGFGGDTAGLGNHGRWPVHQRSASNVSGNQTKHALSTLTIPNARCPVCKARVYFYQSECGGKVYFDRLGPPWPKHLCTSATLRSGDNTPHRALNGVRVFAVSQVRQPEGAKIVDETWHIIHNITITPRISCVTGNKSGRLTRIQGTPVSEKRNITLTSLDIDVPGWLSICSQTPVFVQLNNTEQVVAVSYIDASTLRANFVTPQPLATCTTLPIASKSVETASLEKRSFLKRRGRENCVKPQGNGNSTRSRTIAPTTRTAAAGSPPQALSKEHIATLLSRLGRVKIGVDQQIKKSKEFH